MEKVYSSENFEIMVAFYKIWPWNKLKQLNVLRVIRLKGEVNFFMERFLEVLYFPSTFAVKTENSWR